MRTERDIKNDLSKRLGEVINTLPLEIQMNGPLETIEEAILKDEKYTILTNEFNNAKSTGHTTGNE